MATHADVRRIALALPGAVQTTDDLHFAVAGTAKPKGFVWPWLERLAPKSARVPNPDVIGVRVANLAQKDLMLAADPRAFFTEPHYDGYPAVLVRIAAIGVADLETIITAAWRCRAPASLRKRRD